MGGNVALRALYGLYQAVEPLARGQGALAQPRRQDVDAAAVGAVKLRQGAQIAVAVGAIDAV